MSDRDDRDESRRQIARRQQRKAGDRSAKLASALMKLPKSALGKLALDEDLRAAVDRARAVTAHIARRRAERTLAGELRRIDLVELAARLAHVERTGAAASLPFHLAEQWRARLIDEGLAAAATFPGGAGAPLPALIAAAQRERLTGKPPGAGRALFRHIAAALTPPTPGPDDDDDDATAGATDASPDPDDADDDADAADDDDDDDDDDRT